MSREGEEERFLEWRGIEPGDACPKCAGTGSCDYPSTALWGGGMGGMMITSGVCDGCWGSGSKSRPWADLRAMAGRIRALETKAAPADEGEKGAVEGAADRYRKRFPGTCEAMDAVRARLVTNTWDSDFHRLEKRVRGLMDDVLAAAQRTAAPSPVTAAGEEHWPGWFCPQCGPDMGVDEDQCCAACGAYCCAMEAVRLVAAGYDAPAPASAVPGLREAVAGYRDRQVALRDGADKARKREAKARHIGAVAALDCVLDEIARRSPAPADGGEQL